MKIFSFANLAALTLGTLIGLGGMTACSNYLRKDLPIRLEQRDSVQVRADDVAAVSELIDELVRLKFPPEFA